MQFPFPVIMMITADNKIRVEARGAEHQYPDRNTAAVVMDCRTFEAAQQCASEIQELINAISDFDATTVFEARTQIVEIWTRVTELPQLNFPPP